MWDHLSERSQDRAEELLVDLGTRAGRQCLSLEFLPSAADRLDDCRCNHWNGPGDSSQNGAEELLVRLGVSDLTELGNSLQCLTATPDRFDDHRGDLGDDLCEGAQQRTKELLVGVGWCRAGRQECLAPGGQRVGQNRCDVRNHLGERAEDRADEFFICCLGRTAQRARAEFERLSPACDGVEDQRCNLRDHLNQAAHQCAKQLLVSRTWQRERLIRRGCHPEERLVLQVSGGLALEEHRRLAEVELLQAGARGMEERRRRSASRLMLDRVKHRERERRHSPGDGGGCRGGFGFETRRDHHTADFGLRASLASDSALAGPESPSENTLAAACGARVAHPNRR